MTSEQRMSHSIESTVDFFKFIFIDFRIEYFIID